MSFSGLTRESVLKRDCRVEPDNDTQLFKPDNDTVSDISPIIDSFYSDLKSLTALINKAVETCIIGGPDQAAALEKIETQIAASPLAEIVRLAYPVTSEKLEAYKKLQKTMDIYNKYI